MMNFIYYPTTLPVTGHSLASEAPFDELQRHYDVKVVDYNKGTLKQGLNSFRRIIEILKVLYEIWVKSKDTDIIYLTISQTLLGNIKDLLIYSIYFRKLSKMVVHLHGGGIKRLIFDRYRILYMFNKFFISRLGGVIVLGKSLAPVFKGMISEDKIYIVPNFADDYLFLNEDEIMEKFKNTNPLRILFLSNLIPGKGHEELLEAYSSLDKDLQKLIRIDFAGNFESEDQKEKFLDKIKRIEGVKYHGVVYGKEKKKLFSSAHIFCLPTYYYEGQPISILEAYASGCVVVTTNHGGICDIFVDGEDGFYVEKKSPCSIKLALEKILERKEILTGIALRNRQFAERNFRKSTYLGNMNKIVLEIAQNDIRRHE